MKENYHKLCLNELATFNEPKSILLHSCCAPCSSHVISFLAEYFNITILYYNPNISPESEYLKRKAEQIRLIQTLKTKNTLDYLDCDYENDVYESKIKGFESCPEGGNRCQICFELRLSKTAKLAKELHYDYFCSTLTVSPHKNSQKINEIGLNLTREYDIKWLPSDFKKDEGYKKSIQLSKTYNLYRQDYCGCTYSKREK